MDEREIREGLESGRLHPFPLLQHLAKEGDEDGARLVAREGPRRLRGGDALRFRALVREVAPDVLAERDAGLNASRRREAEARTSALGDALRSKNAETRARNGRKTTPPGGGWSLPPAV